MNKTVNINLGGMFFHIDEDAYQKLTRYFDAIKRSLSNSNGQDEIIKDIEMRIGELVSEKHTNEKQVINIKELDEIIAIMGQPEDYRIDIEGDEPQQKSSFNSSTDRVSRKLYRDKENGMISGVLAGLGHYFGVDKVWLRIFFLIMISVFGTGILAYIILWIVMPEAVTTSEKLEMTGEPVTISNIEKKVREEFESVSEKIKNTDFDKVGNQVKAGAERVGSSFGDFIISVLKIFAKFLGVILIMCGLATIIVFTIGVLTLGTTNFSGFPLHDFIDSGNFTDYPLWFFGIIVFFAIAIPNFFLILLGFKLISPSIKSIGNIAKYTLLAIWIIAICILISIGVKQATEFAIDGRVVQKVTIPLAVNDTLQIKFKHSDYFAKNLDENNDFMITEDSTGTKVIYSNEVTINVMKTDQKFAYLQIEREAKGSSLSAAKKTAEKIKYGYQIIGNQLILDNYLLTDFSNKFRNQEVELYLYLPVGTVLKPDSSIQNYDRSDDDYFNLHYSSDNYIYKVGNDKVKCLNCPIDENEWNDVDIDENIQSESDSIVTTSVNVNGQEVIVKQTAGKNGGLTTDVNGVIIKNK